MSTVRALSDEEKSQLQPLLRELHAHVEGCIDCQNAPVPATAAEIGAANFCAVGADLYRRWLRWLAGS